MDSDKYIAQNFIDDWLAEHPPDDDTPIDEQWLLAVGWAPRGMKGSGSYGLNSVELYLSWWRGGVSINGGHRVMISTRGQLRRLCEALGIALKESP